MKQQYSRTKTLLLMIALVIPSVVYAQKDIYKIPIPQKGRVVNYTDTCKFNKGASKTQIFDKAVNWVSLSFKGNELGIESTDKAAGQIKGRGIFKIITSDSGNYYWLKFNINITVTDSTC